MLPTEVINYRLIGYIVQTSERTSIFKKPSLALQPAIFSSNCSQFNSITMKQHQRQVFLHSLRLLPLCCLLIPFGTYPLFKITLSHFYRFPKGCKQQARPLTLTLCSFQFSKIYSISAQGCSTVMETFSSFLLNDACFFLKGESQISALYD